MASTALSSSVSKESSSGPGLQYGAITISADEEGGEDGVQVAPSQDLTDRLYYVKSPALTPEQRLRKLLLIGVPLLAAALLMGGTAWFLVRSVFGPGPPREPHGGTAASSVSSSRSSSSSSYSSSTTGHATTGSSPQWPRSPSSPAQSPMTHKTGSSSAACSAHSNCEGLGGDCCPTSEGMYLDCC